MGWLVGLLLLSCLFVAALSAKAAEGGESLKAEAAFELQPFSLKLVDSMLPVDSALPERIITAELTSPALTAPEFSPSLTIVPRIRFSDSVFTGSMVMCVALNAADYFLTKEALRYDGVEEGNSFLKGIVKDPWVFAAVKLGSTALNVYLLNTVYKKNKTLGWILTTVTNSLLGYVVAHNIDGLAKAKRLSTLR
jgi:hypothetical protein